MLWLPCDRALLGRLRVCLVCKQLALPWLQVVAGVIPVGILCQQCSVALGTDLKFRA